MDFFLPIGLSARLVDIVANVDLATVLRYTSMVGKKSTLKALRHRLLSAGVNAVRTTEFFQVRASHLGIPLINVM